MALLYLLIALLTFSIVSASAPICGRKCTFRLCQANGEGSLRVKGTKIIQRGPGAALAPYICKPGTNLGLVRETGEALVTPFNSGEDAVPISKYNPGGRVNPKYPKNYFKLFRIDFLGGLQGIGRKKTMGNQNKFADDLCVVLPVTKWDVLSKDGTVADTVTSRDPNDCVSYRTNAPVILIELQWSSSDDFDLSVEEPDGDVISKANPKSETGRLNNDIGVGACGIIPSGKENILYKRGDVPIERGEYVVTVKQFNNCGLGASKYRVRVYVNGRTVKDVDGVANLDNGAVVDTVTFKY